MAIRFKPSVWYCMDERKVDIVVVLGLFKPCFNWPIQRQCRLVERILAKMN